MTVKQLSAEVAMLRGELVDLRRECEDAAQAAGEMLFTRRLTIVNAASIPVATIEADPRGGGVLVLSAPDGEPRLLLHGQATSGLIQVHDQAGPPVAILEGGGGYGHLELRGPGNSKHDFGPRPEEAIEDPPPDRTGPGADRRR